MANLQTNTIAARILNPEAKVFITVTIGNAQIGGTLLKWINETGHIAKGIIQNVYLGYGAEIAGKSLDIVTNIIDINPATNGVVVTYYFHNCEPPAFTFADSVENEGDIFSFKTITNFIL